MASAAETIATAARANIDRNWHRGHDHDELQHEVVQLRRQIEQLAHGRELALTAVAGQLEALFRGEQPPAWSEAKDEGTVDSAAADVVRLVGMLQDREAGIVSSVVSLAQRWQTEAQKIEDLALTILKRHEDDADALQDYFSISHAAATQARAAQSLVVLAGKRTARQFAEPQPLDKVVQHASAYIVDYQRVQVEGTPGVAVISVLAEQLIHLIAELLANATREAPPSTPVTVTFEKVDVGWAITIHDDGPGLGDRLRWAQDRVSGQRRVGLHELGAIPETGLAVVGAYCQKHKFRVHLDSTANGGVRAVITVPQHLLVPVVASPDLPVPPAPRQPPLTSAPSEPAAPGKHRDLGPEAIPTGGTTRGGLPIRVPQVPIPGNSPTTPTAPPHASAPDPAAEGDLMKAIVRGSLADPATTTSDAPTTIDGEEPR
ncbi:ATP-binding protein [Amycolatopsis sp. OK19-0408]|uniref:histidine kinase n=1 Tax=Amycolatopsis iheyensis TaxID=2945988 RepID=A0A9X2NID6_9PSEU|nr:ATP-binding protein [Amycolatopsis iheyensis]MCR6488337.1 ATP-binding protein [Amycolatopsis iheyensis]